MAPRCSSLGKAGRGYFAKGTPVPWFAMPCVPNSGLSAERCSVVPSMPTPGLGLCSGHPAPMGS